MKWLFVLTLILSACAKNQSQSKDEPSAAPLSEVSTWCGETILSADGFSFQIDLTTGATTMLTDGQYGYDSYQNGWYETIPACWFKIVNGQPEAI